MKILFVSLILFSFVASCDNEIKQSNNPWPRHTIDNFSSGADGVRLADVNGDGLTDIATGWEEGGFTKVYFHPGRTDVREHWPSVVIGYSPSVEDAVFADLDDDGNVDVISSTEGTNRKMYVHWAPDKSDYLDSSSWQTESIPAADRLMQWMFAVSAQLDDKHGIDIIAGAKGKGAKVGWFESPANPRSLSEWKWHPISDATWIMSIITSDMDNDGDLDIVLSDRKPGESNGIRWLENPGAQNVHANWENHFVGAKGLEVMFMDIADIDGDGLDDVITCERTNQTLIIWRSLDTSGTKWEESMISMPEHVGLAKAVKVGDINVDGIQDIVLSTNTMGDDEKKGIVYLSFSKAGDFSNYSWHTLSGNEGYKFDRLELIDLDNDGDLDLLTCEENYGPNSEGLGVIWYENPLR